ncbi:MULTISPECIES: bifunctional 3,4-dihydroxy-2-butanone-4-phosphate synthase/GTP cyclohydrolase II [Streptomyces]|uniref:bifunctional 3,4-dihydroxy-2-butanone-4-phosphate synthase/GTP cyclohydrolase II n=1 Tax=Streptomyces TaxID=1883 RepID=UPI002F90B855|nr:bifunctional 3,4-dihydroxy-2-butanone-4-phosphate synthase/GTP cyclohydrolase II [Streptomyces chartreusis]WTA33457.1 bifunctional 3,4-dihydroxy-2-butanone-4-phosphate synthase/GTP cyclohydrolase II [Streptomyces chartreusis]
MQAVDDALEALARGGIVVVADDDDRENEGDLVMAADAMTEADMVFYLRYGSGIVCATVTGERADVLDLPFMVQDNTDPHGTAFTVTVDHVSTGTGISAADRAATVRAIADPTTRPECLRRPGHVFPLRARRGGVLKRAGHTEASVDLLRLAGRRKVGAITELVGDDGRPLTGHGLRQFAAAHGLPLVQISDLVRHRRSSEHLVARSGEASLPTDHGEFRAVAYRSATDDAEHLALVHGDLEAGIDSGGAVLVRVHSECLTGDLFASARCDCGHQLRQSLARIAEAGVGVLIYLRGHEGRGIGLGHKLRAYELQDTGRDTVDANTDLGLPVDGRDYGIGAAMLSDLGIRRIKLLTNNPSKYSGLRGYDLQIAERIGVPPRVTSHNLAYLTTKRDRMGHLIALPEAGDGA